jgi:dipeptidyl-peptidase 4
VVSSAATSEMAAPVHITAFSPSRTSRAPAIPPATDVKYSGSKTRLSVVARRFSGTEVAGRRSVAEQPGSYTGPMARNPTRLTAELVARVPRPGMVAPGAIRYSPDGSYVTYLFSERGDLVRDLWRLDLKTGLRERWLTPPEHGVSESNVSREEALRRERQRIQTTGITHYAWAEDANALVLPIGDNVYLWRDGALTILVDHATDPRISRDGRRVFFVREGEVWYVDDEGIGPLTSGSEPGVTNGLAEFIAQEELDRQHGLWPSPDGTLVAFEQADERHIPIYPIVHQATDKPEVEEHRYAFAGTANVRVKLGVASLKGEVAWLDMGPDEDLYLARVDWHPDGRLFVQLLSRDQRRLELKSFEPGLWSPRTLLVEESTTWVNLHDDLLFVKGTGEFTWSSERSGYRHLSLHGPDGSLVRRLTEGEWPVDGVRGIDEKNRQLYFAAWMDTPVERHVYRVSLDGGEPIRLTTEAGMHDAVVAPDGSSFVDIFDSRTQPPSCVVRQPDANAIWTLHEASAIELELRTPELETFTTRDGVTLHAAVFRPATKAAAALIVDVYGGPHYQAVTNSWALTVNLRAQLLAAQGFVVMQVDNRGSARRGVAFETALAQNMGDIEVRDQVDGVRWLQKRGIADLTQVGIYGWSYGGYLTAMALVKARDVFTVGVAGAPVTSWDGYDTGYTERYMGTPASNPEGYRGSSVITHVDQLHGKLLLVHGMLDENVHFRHSARLMQALIDKQAQFDVLLYPNERHLPRSLEDRVAMETRILEYFMNHLAPDSVDPSKRPARRSPADD